MDKTNYEFLDELDPSLMGTERGRWIDIFRHFMESDQKNCVISFPSEKDRKLCLASLGNWKRKNNLDIVYGRYAPGVRIYITKL